MKTITNKHEFEQILATDKTILIDFYAEWCGPCQTLLPILETVSTDYENNLEVVKINVDQHPDLAAQYGVRSIPRVFFIKNKTIVDQFVGLHSRADIDEKINKINAL